SPKISMHVASHGDLDTLKWLREGYICPLSDQTCIVALSSFYKKKKKDGRKDEKTKQRKKLQEEKQKYWEVVKWGIKNGCPKSRRLCSMVAENGDLVKLQWLRKHNCQWDSETVLKALSEYLMF